jgi:outer membrane protein assembly factor BamA
MTLEEELHLKSVILLLLFLLLAGCTSIVPGSRLPFPLATGEFTETNKVVTVPLPVIAASPNEGVALGALAAFLIHNGSDEVSTLIAPQVNYNDNFGTTASLYGAFYPSPVRSWDINLSKSTRVNEDYELKYLDKSFLARQLELNAFLFRFTDGSARFFGFHSTSSALAETNFADAETGFNISAGYFIARNLQLVAGERYKRVDIKRGAVVKIPYLRDHFTSASVPGLDGFAAHAQKIALVYSTLDSSTLPTEGLSAALSAETSFRALGSTASYSHYNMELKVYFPLAEKRFITVGRVAWNETLGAKVPFLERSLLGGENSLRGFGRNRFIDSTSLLINLEQRIRLFRWEVFDVLADWELAPFLDLGAVTEATAQLRSRDFVWSPGVGFRAVVRPNIVGRIDIGWGKDGAAVFVGLGYPF